MRKESWRANQFQVLLKSNKYSFKIIIQTNHNSSCFSGPYTDSYISEISFAAVRKSSSRYLESCVNHNARAHRVPLMTPLTPWKLSVPAENATMRPHLGCTVACNREKKRKRKKTHQNVNQNVNNYPSSNEMDRGILCGHFNTKTVHMGRVICQRRQVHHYFVQ